MRMVDSDILIDVLRDFPPAVHWIASQKVLPWVCGFTVMELWAGCKNKTQVRAVNRVLQDLPILWPTEAELQQAMERFPGRRLSHNMSILDAFIGECAAGRGLTLCTFNVKHFQAIPGLLTEQPYPR
jgi:predicted nucleic acid-binding protein